MMEEGVLPASFPLSHISSFTHVLFHTIPLLHISSFTHSSPRAPAPKGDPRAQSPPPPQPTGPAPPHGMESPELHLLPRSPQSPLPGRKAPSLPAWSSKPPVRLWELHGIVSLGSAGPGDQGRAFPSQAGKLRHREPHASLCQRQGTRSATLAHM